MKKLFILAALLPFYAHALTWDDVNFAQRQCAQRNDQAKCHHARTLSRHYQIQERNKLEYNAEVRANQPMRGSVHVYSEPDFGGMYRWSHNAKKYCYHNQHGRVLRCVN